MRFDDAFGNGKPEARALASVADHPAGADKLVEHARQQLRWYSGAVIRYADQDLIGF
jgi:hypothetical protein